jgi:hypothetical protein
MPLSSKEASSELWSEIINKNTGKPYTGLERCNDIDRFSSENQDLSDLLQDKMEEWREKKPKEYAEKIGQFTKEGGFQYKHDDGWTYKIVKSTNGQLNLSRSKASSWAGKGGYGGGLTMRTVSIRVGNMEAVSAILASQEQTDFYKISFMKTEKTGDVFLMELQKPYSTKAPEPAKEEKKDNGSEEESETETEE